MATSVRPMLLLWVCTATDIIYNAQVAQSQDQMGRITRLQPSVNLSQRALACNGEAVTLTCTSNGSGINWKSDPSLSMSQTQNLIHGFEHNQVAGSEFSYLLNYTDGTAFYISGVLEDVSGGSCNSSITFIPIPNDAGLYPTYYTTMFTITCFTGSLGPETSTERFWQYRVAAVPVRVPDTNATCTYYLSHKVVQVEITRQQNRSVDLRYYEVSTNGMQITVLAQSDNKTVAGLFYPVEEPTKAEMTVQIVTVDMCGQRSDPTVISCRNSTPEPPTKLPPTCSKGATGPAGTDTHISTISITIWILITILFLYNCILLDYV